MYDRYDDRAAELSLHWQRWFESRMQGVPLIAENYVAWVLLSSIVLVVFVHAFSQPLMYFALERWPVLFPLLFGGILIAMMWLVYRAVQSVHRHESAAYQQRGHNVDTTTASATVAVIVLAASALYAYLSYLFVDSVSSLLSVVPTPSAAVIVVAAGLPVLYLGGVLAYQLASVVAMLGLLTLSVDGWYQPSIDLAVDPIVIDHNSCFAGAISVGPTGYILVSTGLLEHLDGRAVAAVLAFEVVVLPDAMPAFQAGFYGLLVNATLFVAVSLLADPVPVENREKIQGYVRYAARKGWEAGESPPAAADD